MNVNSRDGAGGKDNNDEKGWIDVVEYLASLVRGNIIENLLFECIRLQVIECITLLQVVVRQRLFILGYFRQRR